VGALVKNRIDLLEPPLDDTDFAVDPETYAAFLKRLDAPPQPNARLLRSLRTRAPWEK
jgi:uncharacterized protein (DUF1778 family)